MRARANKPVYVRNRTISGIPREAGRAAILRTLLLRVANTLTDAEIAHVAARALLMRSAQCCCCPECAIAFLASSAAPSMFCQAHTHGFVGADLLALTREAALRTLADSPLPEVRSAWDL
jgi:hypothetical protein